MTVDQRLTSNISFYGSAFYSNRRGHYLNPSNLSPSGTNILNGVGIPTFNPYYPTGAPTRPARPLQYRLGKPEHHLVLRVGAALSIGPQHRASGRLERPRLVLADAGRELQHRQRHHEQKRGLRGLGLDHRGDPAGRLHACASGHGRSPAAFPISTSSATRWPMRVTRPKRSPTSRASEASTSATGSTKRACSSTARCSIFRAARSRPLSARPTPASVCRRRFWTTPAPRA